MGKPPGLSDWGGLAAWAGQGAGWPFKGAGSSLKHGLSPPGGRAAPSSDPTWWLLPPPSPLPLSPSLPSPGAAQPSPPAMAQRVSASSPSPGLSRGPGRREDTGESEGSREPSHRHLHLVPASPSPHGQAPLVVPTLGGGTGPPHALGARWPGLSRVTHCTGHHRCPSPISAFSPLCPSRRSRSPKNKRKEKNKERKR